MFETGSDRRVSVQRPSAVCGKRSGDGERDSGLARKVFGIAPEPAFTISPESRSESTRNRVRLHPGMAFGLPRIPHYRSLTLEQAVRSALQSRCHNHVSIGLHMAGFPAITEGPTLPN
jgi:hypothetical protein